MYYTLLSSEGGQVSARDGEAAQPPHRRPDDKQGRAREGSADGAGVQGAELALRPEPQEVRDIMLNMLNMLHVEQRWSEVSSATLSLSQVEQLSAAARRQPREGDVPQRAGRGHRSREELLHRAGGGHPLQPEDSQLGERSGEEEPEKYCICLPSFGNKKLRIF